MNSKAIIISGCVSATALAAAFLAGQGSSVPRLAEIPQPVVAEVAENDAPPSKQSKKIYSPAEIDAMADRGAHMLATEAALASGASSANEVNMVADAQYAQSAQLKIVEAWQGQRDSFEIVASAAVKCGLRKPAWKEHLLDRFSEKMERDRRYSAALAALSPEERKAAEGYRSSNHPYLKKFWSMPCPEWRRMPILRAYDEMLIGIRDFPAPSAS